MHRSACHSEPMLKLVLASRLALLALALCACDSDEDMGMDASSCSTDVCEALSPIAMELGCGPIDETQCKCDEGCAAEARAFIDCLAQDVTQCQCEAPGRLNCEGGFKPGEGPALCVAENEALEACRAR